MCRCIVNMAHGVRCSAILDASAAVPTRLGCHGHGQVHPDRGAVTIHRPPHGRAAGFQRRLHIQTRCMLEQSAGDPAGR
ncbi:hypothetical protein ATANTOWER_016674 [Ataeniobius toweri]|uniref:Uncharacterized protein n=1 Tax=Ataeniobius toweri TaxID=208326 RepID=A0ABU7B4H3_9TELE|nr:hypothetical protein [Ataeniobius toweri]